MNKINLLDNGMIQFGSKKAIMPKNPVISVNDGVIRFLLNKDRLVGSMDIVDYCKLGLYDRCLTFDHANINQGVIAYNTGLEHKSVAAAIMNSEGKRVKFKNYNHLDCRRQNLAVSDR